jgi:hypothetical protein
MINAMRGCIHDVPIGKYNVILFNLYFLKLDQDQNQTEKKEKQFEF